MAKKTVWLPYDMDTAIGINNEGALAFSYDLEDIDHTDGGADIYNGQDSILWQNVRAAYGDEIKAMYKELRSSGALSYEKIEKMFEDHQAKWSEAIFNEDAQFKYIDPLIEDGDATYLSMAQGSKAEQRKWWLWNRFRYLDSKYNAGDALTEVIIFRAYANADVKVTPYASIYASCMYGENNELIQQRASRNQQVTLPRPANFNLNDTAVYIYSADQVSDVGDLSGFKIGFANFARATKLVNLKIGDGDPNYSNLNLGAHQNPALALGNNILLKSIDVRNCPNLTETVNLSGCTNLEEAYFEGTSIKGVSLPNGGALKHLHLPGTITSLIVQNQPLLDDITIADTSNISTLVLENVSDAFDSYALAKGMQLNGRARLIGIDWSIGNADEIMDLLKTLRGIDENGRTTEFAQLSGSIHFDRIRKWQLANLRYRYPYLNVTYTTLQNNYLTDYNNQDATELGTRNIIFKGIKGFTANTPSIPKLVPNESKFPKWYFPDMTQSIAGPIMTNRSGKKRFGFGKNGDTEVIPLTYKLYIGDNSNSGNESFYVPDDLVEEYKSATNWAFSPDRIFPLSESPDGWGDEE